MFYHLHSDPQELNRIKKLTVKSLLNKMNAEDVDGVTKLLGPDLKTAMTTPERITFDCRNIHVLFDNYGIPPESTYQIRTRTSGRYSNIVVTVPIYNGFNSVNRQLSAGLEITFGPDELYSPDKIVMYELNQKFTPGSLVSSTIH